jgi:hypothetical protein
VTQEATTEALAGAHDTCVRCGRPTPIGVSLCPDDNPGRIGGPSTTQMHGTIFIGVVLGFVLLALLARISLSGVGPFEARLSSATARSDGAVLVSFEVANRGTGQSVSTCRITRGGLPQDDDPVFITEPIPAGGSLRVERLVAQPQAPSPPFQADRIVPLCR